MRWMWHGIEAHHVMDVAWHDMAATSHSPPLSPTLRPFLQPTNEFRKHHKLTNRNLRPHSIHSAFSQTHSRIHTQRPAGNGVAGRIRIITVIILHHPIGVRRARSLQPSPICLVECQRISGCLRGAVLASADLSPFHQLPGEEPVKRFMVVGELTS
jgi:hypothetical protein